ncbi:MAG: hypothetical protein A2X46_05800 [Lentisphaerae bacterium GWF2_57_35]|nr:MAG: hypothetical protein A2X46_05800 [Lentisphaerae bacterium GWF2_57_35]
MGAAIPSAILLYLIQPHHGLSFPEKENKTMKCLSSISTAILAGFFLTGFIAAPETAAADKPLPVEQSERLELKGIEEPSGVCYHTTRKTLFVVDDGGEVCEFTPQGKIVQRKRIRRADFEGIAHDPATGFLYIAIEGEEAILEVDPETLKPRREFPLPRTFEGRTVMKEGGQGIEAIAFVSNPAHPHGGTFFVANQCFDPKKYPEDLSAIFEVEVPLKAESFQPADIKILRCIRPDAIDISALHYDAQRNLLYAVSDETDRLLAFSRTGEQLDAWTLPGENQEGLVMDADGFMYIAQDSGGVLKLKIGSPKP